MAPERDDASPERANPPSAAVALSSRDFAARYAAVAVLSEGPEGKTYRARDRAREGREVALQVLQSRFSKDAELVERCFQDVRIAQSLVSTHVVEILDVGLIEDGRLFVSTALVDGESLAGRVQREGRLRPQAALEVARQTLAALESGHRKGLAHGRVAPEQIWLEARIAKTPENPDGVGVRLLGFGLGMLLAPIVPGEGPNETTPVRREPTQEDDLRAVAALLRSMLDASNSNDRKLRALIGPEAQDPAQRFASAREFARAIEATRTWRARPALPRWAVAGLAVLGIVAVTECFWALEQHSEDLKQIDDAQAIAARRLADTKAQEAFCATQIEELKNKIDAREQEVADLTRKFEALQASKSASHSSESADVRAELERVQKALAQERSEKDQLVANLEETQNRARDLEQKNSALVVASSPSAKAARGFDRLLAMVKTGEGKHALATYEDLAGDGTFPPKDEHTHAFLRTLTQAAAALEELRERSDDAKAVAAARAKLDELKKLGAGFATEAGAWIGERADDGGDPARERAATEAINSLSNQFTAASREFDRAHTADWSRVDGVSRNAGPEEIQRHVERFGCEHLSNWLGGVDAELERALVRDGTLDVDRLCANDTLTRWKSALGERASPLTTWIAARDWYGGTQSVASTRLELPSIASAAPTRDWRAVLALEQALASSDAAFPLARDTLAVWRDEDLINKKAAWYVDELVSSDGVGDTRGWEVRRSVYTTDGTVPSSAQRVLFSRRGVQLLRAGKLIVDLRAHGSTLQAVGWNGAASALPPKKSWFPLAESIATFRAELAKKPTPCLVVQDDTVTRWISPRFGMVREEAPGVFRMELVYVGPKR